MKIFRKLTVLAALSVFAFTAPVLASGKHGAPHWTYEGKEGPNHWASLSKEFATCAAGKNQSPINITGAVSTKLSGITFNYQAAETSLVNNGHTLQFNYPAGSYIEVDGHRYDLLQFHFHSPSEEQVNGKNSDMVVHLVHKDAKGNLAVVGLLLNGSKDGNAIIKGLMKNMPKKDATFTSKDKVNAADLLPADKAYYNFVGSLTTPPCSEGVNWMVLKQNGSVGQDEVAAFVKVFGHNNRPVQPLNGRQIKASM